MESGDRLVALELGRRALELDADCLAAHTLLAAVALDGLPYREAIARIHETLRPARYLEIGVGSGQTLMLVRPETVAVGVDPAPQLQCELPSNVRLVRTTSDAFFANDTLHDAFGGAPPDLAFIDGMHLFEFALRDFINVERIASDKTRVLVHDCYPLDERTSAREQSTTFWTGDVWKLIMCLRKYRPDLEVQTFACPPSGLALVRGLDPSSRALAERYERICEEFVPAGYASLGESKAERLNLVPGNWNGIASLL